jgi:hypothetical protein
VDEAKGEILAQCQCSGTGLVIVTASSRRSDSSATIERKARKSRASSSLSMTPCSEKRANWESSQGVLGEALSGIDVTCGAKTEIGAGWSPGLDRHEEREARNASICREGVIFMELALCD